MEVEEVVDVWLLARTLEKKGIPNSTAAKFLRTYIDRY